ncbi:hypothetical protein [Paracoccus tegillarcae]|nr:hypothetical protein [Paracoccus tegillarcae]
MSGTPKNDAFQAIENQVCSQRLFSMHGAYAPEVMKWLGMVKAGVRTFDDYCQYEPRAIARLEQKDQEQQALLVQRGIEDEWVPYAEALRAASQSRTPSCPSHMMLDSGAFTAWNASASVTLDEVKSAYSRFLTEADGLFEEIWLINLDVIPGEKDRDPTPQEFQTAIQESDRNLAALSAEFGDCVLPVFHQGEGQQRLLDVVNQAKGYLCLSPNNKKPEGERWRWAQLARTALHDLACNVQTHGLATTGNDMIREAHLMSGDSAAWNEHGFYGAVDLVEDETYPQDKFNLVKLENGELDRAGEHIVERSRLRYRGYHIGVEMDDYDLKSQSKMISNDRNVSFLPKRKREWVRAKVESYFPWTLALTDQRARSLICMGELRTFAESFEWRPPGVRQYDGAGKVLLPPFSEVVRTYPTQEDRARFLSDQIYDGRL